MTEQKEEMCTTCYGKGSRTIVRSGCDQAGFPWTESHIESCMACDGRGNVPVKKESSNPEQSNHKILSICKKMP